MEITHPIDLEKGKIYKIHYKLNGQRVYRYAQLEYVGYDLGGSVTLWQGRPSIGPQSLRREEIRNIWTLPKNAVKTTYWDKREPL